MYKKTITKIKQFWNSILTPNEKKEFEQSSYNFFHNRLNDATYSSNSTSSDCSVDDLDEINSEIIINDYGCRMCSCAVSETSVERLFSEITQIMTLHRMSLSDDTLQSIINIRRYK